MASEIQGLPLMRAVRCDRYAIIRPQKISTTSVSPYIYFVELVLPVTLEILLACEAIPVVLVTGRVVELVLSEHVYLLPWISLL